MVVVLLSFSSRNGKEVEGQYMDDSTCKVLCGTPAQFQTKITF